MVQERDETFPADHQDGYDEGIRAKLIVVILIVLLMRVTIIRPQD